MWTLKGLMNSAGSTQAQINGKWVPARPIPLLGIPGLLQRIRDAWAVLRGRAESFEWPEGQ